MNGKADAREGCFECLADLLCDCFDSALLCDCFDTALLCDCFDSALLLGLSSLKISESFGSSIFRRHVSNSRSLIGVDCLISISEIDSSCF